ncbi:hypothetical protein DFH28DRAFT_940099, partial [Melampsora americana]
MTQNTRSTRADLLRARKTAATARPSQASTETPASKEVAAQSSGEQTQPEDSIRQGTHPGGEADAAPEDPPNPGPEDPGEDWDDDIDGEALAKLADGTPPSEADDEASSFVRYATGTKRTINVRAAAEQYNLVRRFYEACKENVEGVLAASDLDLIGQEIHAMNQTLQAIRRS